MARYRYHRRRPLFAIYIDSNDVKNGAQNFQFLETDKAAMNLHRAARARVQQEFAIHMKQTPDDIKERKTRSK
jgi:hypothetical protein